MRDGSWRYPAPLSAQVLHGFCHEARPFNHRGLMPRGDKGTSDKEALSARVHLIPSILLLAEGRHRAPARRCG
jgi:hypothetical protein